MLEPHIQAKNYFRFFLLLRIFNMSVYNLHKVVI